MVIQVTDEYDSGSQLLQATKQIGYTTEREQTGRFCSLGGLLSHTALVKINLSQTAMEARLVQAWKRKRERKQNGSMIDE